MKAPDGLFKGGKKLWKAVTDAHDLDETRLAQLEEACRAKDRCDLLHSLLTEGMDSALLKDANATANLMKQLIAALRLPDEHGKKPQARGPRGAYSPSAPSGTSSLDRARAAKSA